MVPTTMESSGDKNRLRGLSVVIPCYNSSHTIGRQLEALSSQECPLPFEIIVANNGSTDNLAETIERVRHETKLDLRLVDASKVRGVNHARNQGVRAARYEMVLLCDADDIVLDGWLAAYAAVADRCELVGGRNLWFRDGDTPPLELPPSLAPLELRTLGFLPYAIGANCGFRRDIWLEIGGFDEDFVRRGDETDFLWRAQLAGHRMCAVGDAVIAYRQRSERWAEVRTARMTGIGHVQLYAKHRKNGFRTRNPVVGAGRRLARILVRSPRAICGGVHLTNWLCEIAALLGRAQGSLEYRVACF